MLHCPNVRISGKVRKWNGAVFGILRRCAEQDHKKLSRGDGALLILALDAPFTEGPYSHDKGKKTKRNAQEKRGGEETGGRKKARRVGTPVSNAAIHLQA